jgi:hypothetical protein
MSGHIENSDRGITLSKSLAWTLIVGLVGGGFWVGSSLSGLQSTVNTLSTSFSEIKAVNAAQTARVTALERAQSRDAARMAELGRVLERIDDKLDDLSKQLRDGR